MAVELTEEHIVRVFEEASSDLKFLFDKEGVDRMVQAKLYDAGVFTVKQFAVLCKDMDELREMSKDSLGIDPSKGLKDKAKLSKVLVAFEVAKARSTRLAELDGDASAREVPKSLPATDSRGMRDSFEKMYWGAGGSEGSLEVVPREEARYDREERLEGGEALGRDVGGRG